jgi:hypothetical protein
MAKSPEVERLHDALGIAVRKRGHELPGTIERVADRLERRVILGYVEHLGLSPIIGAMVDTMSPTSMKEP